jgi:hypothetical protein
MRLENWSLSKRWGTNDHYRDPACVPVCLQGNVYGHGSPRHPDGKGIITSGIESVEGRVVKTRTGSVYELGKIDPDYRAYLKEHHPDWDWRNPIRIV